MVCCLSAAPRPPALCSLGFLLQSSQDVARCGISARCQDCALLCCCLQGRADGHLMLESNGETPPGLVARSCWEQHGSRKEDDGCHRPVSCRRCLNSRERCSVLHLLLEKSKMCFVLCARRRRGALAGRAGLGCGSSPGSAAGSEAEGLQPLRKSSLSPHLGCSWCWEPLPPAASGQNSTSESQTGGNRLWAAPGAVGPFAPGGVGSAQVEGTRLLHKFGWKTQSRHR